MVNFYRSFVEEFKCHLAKLDAQSAYASIENISTMISRDSLNSTTPNCYPFYWNSPDNFPNPSVTQYLENAFGAYKTLNTDLMESILNKMLEGDDNLLAIDIRQLLGRMVFKKGDLEGAQNLFMECLEQSAKYRYSFGFINALHEISRLHESKYRLIEAEAGFRIVLSFYIRYVQFLQREFDPLTGNSVAVENLQMAVNCLGGVADVYTSFSNGPTEAIDLLDSFCSSLFRSTDNTGYEFLEIHALAINAVVRKHHLTIPRLIGKAMSLYSKHKDIAIFGLKESVWAGEMMGVSYPKAIMQSILQEHTLNLAKEPHFKPDIQVQKETSRDFRFSAPDRPADSIEQLYDYLLTENNGGRYVYRGQTREYAAPLLPSSFRDILRSSFPLKVVERAELDSVTSLRNCGNNFIGEYNECFSYYADIMRQDREKGLPMSEIESIFSVYKKLLDNPFIPLKQDAETFRPWQAMVKEYLTESEMHIYLSNSSAWNPRINNYHKRIYRNKVLFKLFDYTLGTTFAQQYGYSSEGLDASKSIEVASFFATHDPAEFKNTMTEGVGVIYRIPFPKNDIASLPIQDFNYYNLPSIIDVEDIFYRFENPELSLEDSIQCISAYLTGSFTYHMSNNNMLMLPKDFLCTTRVHAQEAVIILPDEIREDMPDRKPGEGGIVFPKSRFIEDLKQRAGVESFYFKHKGIWPKKLSHINREYLWPRNDLLLQTFILTIASSYRMSQSLPKRLDLIDGGYDHEEFHNLCRDLYTKHRNTFVTPMEDIARANGVIV